MKQVNTEERKNIRSHSKKILVQPCLRLCSLGVEFCSYEDSFNKAAPLSYVLLSQQKKNPPPTHTHTNKQTHTNHVCLRKLAVGTAAIIAIRLFLLQELCIIYGYNYELI